MLIQDRTFILFIFLMAIYGLANAIAVLKIGQFIFGISHCRKEGCVASRHPRELRKFLGRVPYLGDLFYCPPCLAFWFGMGMSRFVVSPFAFVTDVAWKATVMDGLLASGVVWLLHLFAERLGHGLDV
jgi:hypothetical protein